MAIVHERLVNLGKLALGLLLQLSQTGWPSAHCHIRTCKYFGAEVDADASYFNYTAQRRAIAIHHLYHQNIYHHHRHHFYHLYHITTIIFTIITIIFITIIIIITGGLISSRHTGHSSSWQPPALCTRRAISKFSTNLRCFSDVLKTKYWP